MNESSFHRRFVSTAAAMSVLCFLAANTPRAYADRIEPPAVPPEIQVPPGNVVYLVAHAVGTQNYTCSGAGAWGSSVPQADLFDDNGHQIGTHFAGPTWQAKDGSSVVGSRVASVSFSADAIPWLLLRAASTSAGPDGDRLIRTTYIQRVNTTGGLAPPGACILGTTASVAYTADYYFYRAAGAEE